MVYPWRFRAAYAFLVLVGAALVGFCLASFAVRPAAASDPRCRWSTPPATTFADCVLRRMHQADAAGLTGMRTLAVRCDRVARRDYNCLIVARPNGEKVVQCARATFRWFPGAPFHRSTKLLNTKASPCL